MNGDSLLNELRPLVLNVYIGDLIHVLPVELEALNRLNKGRSYQEKVGVIRVDWGTWGHLHFWGRTELDATFIFTIRSLRLRIWDCFIHWLFIGFKLLDLHDVIPIFALLACHVHAVYIILIVLVIYILVGVLPYLFTIRLLEPFACSEVKVCAWLSWNI